MEDYIQINDINPYTPEDIMPGTWSGSFPYSKHDSDSDSDSESDIESEDSPLCGYANTMGDGTIHSCNPTPPNCPLGRPLVPGRNIEDGLWSLPCSMNNQANGPPGGIPLFVIVVVLSILITASLRT